MSTQAPIEIIARALIIHRGSVLMCRNKAGNYLYLPGGHVEFGEPAAVALARELQEEAAVDIQVGPLVRLSEHHFVSVKTPHHELTLVFHVEHLGGVHLPEVDQRPDVESVEEYIAIEWVDLAAVSDLDVRPGEIKAWLALGAPIEGGRVGFVSGMGPD